MDSTGPDLDSKLRRNGNTITCNTQNIISNNGMICAARKKSASFQPQIQFGFNANGDESIHCSSTTGRCSPHPNDIFQSQTGKLKISSLEKSNDIAIGHLPPPSPAPNSDCFASCISPTHVSIKSDTLSISHKLNVGVSISGTYSHQRCASPNSRYRLDRYRDVQSVPKTKEAVNHSSALPSNSSSTRLLLPVTPTLPLVQCDTLNSFLGSTVHTPVKRYIPTPPPANDIFSDLQLTSSSATLLPIATSSQSQYANMPHSYRNKCCHTENSDTVQNSLLKSAQTFNITASCSSSCNSPLPTTTSAVSVAFSTPTDCSPNTTTSGMRNKTRSTIPNSEITRLSTSFSDDSEPVIVISPSMTANNPEVITSTGTCIHCNTARRTTGVHQTTQTTGPISPVPLPLTIPLSIPLTSSEQVSNVTVSLSQASMESNVLTGQLKINDNCNTELQRESNHNQIFAPGSGSTVKQMINTPRIQQPQMNTVHNMHPQAQQQTPQTLPQQQQQQQGNHYSCKKRLSKYMKREVSSFFGVELSTESEDFCLWYGRHRRLAIRRFGLLQSHCQASNGSNVSTHSSINHRTTHEQNQNCSHVNYCYAPDRPDILPAHNVDISSQSRKYYSNSDFHNDEFVERKPSVAHMLMSTLAYIIYIFNKGSSRHCNNLADQRYWQWSRSFAPLHVQKSSPEIDSGNIQVDYETEFTLNLSDTLIALIDDEVFFDNPCESTLSSIDSGTEIVRQINKQPLSTAMTTGTTAGAGVYMGERHQNGWRTSALSSNENGNNDINLTHDQNIHQVNTNHMHLGSSIPSQVHTAIRSSNLSSSMAYRGTRITAQVLDGVLENSRRPPNKCIKYFSVNDLDDRTDYRPYFTYWINTVQVIVLCLSIMCYGIAPIGFGSEQKTGQVLVTSLSLQTVQHVVQRNFWIGPRHNDLVHMGAKFAACMRRDMKITEVLTKTRRQERETACCIRNDDSGCVQSSQADCSIRGLYPTKSISTWKKWSPVESGPGGRISGSVCGLDPKFCDAPASIAPYEWPDDITKWPICRKTNSFSQRYRYKDHTSEHMVCEVIGHPCCTGLYGECRITTREYCEFVNGYFHEEASLCSQISCLNNVCGMFPFISVETPDQIYRLLTSLCMHAGVLHLAITLVFQQLFLTDLERLLGTVRTAIVYVVSGLAGNLTSAVFLPHRSEVGPSASLCGVVSSLIALLILMHWNHLHKPHVALFKLIMLCAVLFAIGTLPYQLNFFALFTGVTCGAFITISLVPFTSFTKYGRKKRLISYGLAFFSISAYVVH
ncbi:inactive rhomboid protein 1 isoform X2 [Drosophila tropicalis]|uniref:inactive rhomboid protein 1 isoform X2 n=1 Tax=Drosophila tropicalis TaxID=46794 RepID=UPI0035AC0BF5